MKISVIKIVVIMFLITSCGFKVVNQSELINFKIAEVSISGDNRISYIIKNKLLPYSTNNTKKSINLEINIKKNKSIKEKNIKNEITKFEILIIAVVEYNEIETAKFEISENGDYTVTSQYSETLNNERKLVKILSENIAENIIEELILRADDL